MKVDGSRVGGVLKTSAVLDHLMAFINAACNMMFALERFCVTFTLF